MPYSQDDLIAHKKTIIDDSYPTVYEDEPASLAEEAIELKKWWQDYQAQEARFIKLKKDKEILETQQKQADKAFLWSDILDNFINLVGAILGFIFKTSLFPLISSSITATEKNSVSTAASALSSDDETTKGMRIFSASVSLLLIIPIIITTILALPAAVVMSMVATGVDWAKDGWIFGKELVSHFWGSAHQAVKQLSADQKVFAKKVNELAGMDTLHPDFHEKHIALQKLHEKINKEIDGNINHKADLATKGHDFAVTSTAFLGLGLMLFPPTCVLGLVIFVTATAYNITYKINPKDWVGHVRNHIYPHPQHLENELDLIIENARKQLSLTQSAITANQTRLVIDALAAQPQRAPMMHDYHPQTSATVMKLEAPVKGFGLYNNAIPNTVIAAKKQTTSNSLRFN